MSSLCPETRNRKNKDYVFSLSSHQHAVPINTFRVLPIVYVSQHVPIVSQHVPIVSQHVPILVYCVVGGRSERVRDALESMGYSKVKNGGGFDEFCQCVLEKS